MYRLEVARQARKEMARLSPEVRRRLLRAIHRLTEEPYPAGCKRLRGTPAYAVRVGDYRIVYRVDDEQGLVIVIRAKHRKDVYRDL